jgi:hypothetical protein
MKLNFHAHLTRLEVRNLFCENILKINLRPNPAKLSRNALKALVIHLFISLAVQKYHLFVILAVACLGWKRME